MIVCKRCGKENEDHYKFCLGCGAELVADEATAHTMMAEGQGPSVSGNAQSAIPPLASTPFTPPPGSMQAPSGGDVASARPNSGADVPPLLNDSVVNPTPEPSQEPATRICSSCGAEVPPKFAFCGVCGTKMDAQPEPQEVPGLQGNQVPESEPEPTPAPAAAGRLTLIRPDGSEGETLDLENGITPIGRDGRALFANDGYLSPQHAELELNGGNASVRDCGSLNGVFVKLTAEHELNSGDIFRIGQELLRFDALRPPENAADGTEIMGSPNPGYWGKLSLIVGQGMDGAAFPIAKPAITLGRERGEINFPEDGYVSGLHAQVSKKDGRVVLQDLGSSNGTFVRIKGDVPIPHGAFLLMGQQLFRLDIL